MGLDLVLNAALDTVDLNALPVRFSQALGLLKAPFAALKFGDLPANSSDLPDLNSLFHLEASLHLDMTLGILGGTFLNFPFDVDFDTWLRNAFLRINTGTAIRVNIALGPISKSLQLMANPPLEVSIIDGELAFGMLARVTQSAALSLAAIPLDVGSTVVGSFLRHLAWDISGVATGTLPLDLNLNNGSVRLQPIIILSSDSLFDTATQPQVEVDWNLAPLFQQDQSLSKMMAGLEAFLLDVVGVDVELSSIASSIPSFFSGFTSSLDVFSSLLEEYFDMFQLFQLHASDPLILEIALFRKLNATFPAVFADFVWQPRAVLPSWNGVLFTALDFMPHVYQLFGLAELNSNKFVGLDLDLTTASPVLFGLPVLRGSTLTPHLSLHTLRAALFSRVPTLRNCLVYFLRRFPAALFARQLTAGPLSVALAYDSDASKMIFDLGLNLQGSATGTEILDTVRQTLGGFLRFISSSDHVQGLASLSPGDLVDQLESLGLAAEVNVSAAIFTMTRAELSLNWPPSFSVALLEARASLVVSVAEVSSQLRIGGVTLQLDRAAAVMNISAATNISAAQPVSALLAPDFTWQGSFQAQLPLKFDLGNIVLPPFDAFLDKALSITVEIADTNIFDADPPTVRVPAIELPSCSETGSIAVEYLTQVVEFLESLKTGISTTIDKLSEQRISILGTTQPLSLGADAKSIFTEWVDKMIVTIKAFQSQAETVKVPLLDLPLGDLVGAAMCLIPDLSGQQELKFLWEKVFALDLGMGSLSTLPALLGDITGNNQPMTDLQEEAGGFQLMMEARFVFKASLLLNATQSFIAVSASLVVNGEAALAATIKWPSFATAVEIQGKLALQDAGVDLLFPGEGLLMDANAFASQISRIRLGPFRGLLAGDLCVGIASADLSILNQLPRPTVILRDENVFDGIPPLVFLDGDITPLKPTILQLLEQLAAVNLQFSSLKSGTILPGVSVDKLMPPLSSIFTQVQAAAISYFDGMDPPPPSYTCAASSNIPTFKGLVAALLETVQKFELGGLAIKGGLFPATKQFSLEFQLDWHTDLADFAGLAKQFRSAFGLLAKSSSMLNPDNNQDNSSLPSNFELGPDLITFEVSTRRQHFQLFGLVFV